MVSLSVLLLLSYYFSSHASAKDNEVVDPSRTILWGPGLNPERVTMRARYFFIQLYDTDGKNITKSPGNDVVSAEIKGQTEYGQSCHIWTQVLDCNDGSFIVRYKLYDTCLNLRIDVRVKKELVTLKSSVFKGPVFEEECHCPNPSVNAWLKDYECPEKYSQIDDDLSLFPSVDYDQIRNSIIKEYHKPNSVSICHYIVKSNKTMVKSGRISIPAVAQSLEQKNVHRQCYGQHVGFKIFMDSLLLSLARKVVLPDTEFFMNLGDWPLVPMHKEPYPMFSWCGSKDSRDIVLPTYDITESSLESMGRVMLDMLSVQGNTKVPWEQKIEKLFWRGRDSRRERLDVIDIARKHPDLFNASITNFFFLKDEVEKYGPATRHISFFDFFRYKYQLNIDGTVAAYRFPYLLAGDSLVFKQESKYYEYFYRHAVPGEHYMPVKSDLSDLVEKVRWAKNHDEEARKISKAGRYLMRDTALPRDVLCYHVSLLREWNKRIKSEVRVLKDMEEVPQPEHSCDCNRALETDSINSKDEL